MGAGSSTEADSKVTPNSKSVVGKPIQIVQLSKTASDFAAFAKDEVDIPDLLKKNKLNYRQSKRVREQVDNQFANGFFKDDPLEAMLIRQSAYCLSLGFSLQYIRQVQAPEYERLLKLSKARKTAHNQR